MVSPAQRHRMMVLGRAAAAAAAEATAMPGAGRAEISEYELLRARLGLALRQLKEIQAVERKIEAKRTMLPEFAPWIDGVLAADAAGHGGAADDIVTEIMIWRFDVADYAGALPLAAYVLKHRLSLPERFKRTAATLIAELSADAALQALGQGEPFDLGVLLEVESLTEDEDMIDQVRAKLMKAIGQLAARAAEGLEPDADGPAGGKRAALEAGIAHLRRALQLDPAAGVKTAIGKIERDLKKLQLPAPPAATK